VAIGLGAIIGFGLDPVLRVSAYIFPVKPVVDPGVQMKSFALLPF